jgi:hypothetical protein
VIPFSLFSEVLFSVILFLEEQEKIINKSSIFKILCFIFLIGYNNCICLLLLYTIF